MNVDLSRLGTDKKFKVVGNLPYYLTTKIIFYLIGYRELISSAILTMQKEVAERILANPGGKTYGRLTVGVKAFCECEKLFEIKKNSFYPLPKVASTVLLFKFKKKIPKDVDEALFLAVVEALFQERRKNIQNGLCLVKSQKIQKAESKEIIERCGLDIKKRAEELNFADFVSLTREMFQ